MTHLDFKIKGGSLELHYNLLGFVWSMLNWRVFSSCRKDGVSSHKKKVFCWVFLSHFDPVTKRDYLLKEFVVFVNPFMKVFSVSFIYWYWACFFPKTFKRFIYYLKRFFWDIYLCPFFVYFASINNIIILQLTYKLFKLPIVCFMNGNLHSISLIQWT